MSEPTADPSCLFCRIVAGEIPATVVERDDLFLAFRDIDPKAPVHVLAVPVRHVPSIAGVSGLTEAERAAMLPFVAGVAKGLDLEEGGYRVTTNHGSNGRQSVLHLHWHIMGGELLSATM